MPYRWDTDADGTRRLLLWRHRSLEPSGFAWVMGLAAAALGLPLLAVVGSPILWGLLPFAVGALWALGMGEPFPVSATHGRGSGDLLDEILARLPAASRVPGSAHSRLGRSAPSPAPVQPNGQIIAGSRAA